jgi:nicotinate-nucleotide--dimethylbenzimidazole phosphoribosyltransferase
MEKAQERLDFLLKPAGSLGKLEDIARQLAGITGKINNSIDPKCIIVMCSDNGIVEENVTSFPQKVSLLVAETMVKGISGVAVLARHAGATIKVVDIGLMGTSTETGIIQKKIRNATSNFSQGPAMSRDEAIQAIKTGIEITNQAIDEGINLLGTGEVGIGNTTSSSAVLYALTDADIGKVVGKGAGLSDEGLAHKKDVIRKSVDHNNPNPNDPIDVLAKVGGFDIAGLVGTYIAAAQRRVPIVVDGFISGVAAVLAMKLKKEAVDFMLLSHISAEPGSQLIYQILGKKPMLDMNMRLGEGTGCALAFHIIDAATKMMNDMGTFGDIGM